ncbi:MAG: PilN domain-containing protein [Desulfobacterales bacterium]|nr:PilN domain-containing protein [Desulfobacterales bacterium]
MIDRINLVPKKPLSSKIKDKIPPVLVLVLAIIALNLYVQDRSLTNRINQAGKDRALLQQSTDNYSRSLNRFQAKKAELARLNQQNSLVAARVRRLTGLRHQKKIFSELLAVIAAATPPSIVFRSIRFNGNNGELSGEARGYEDLPGLVERLRNSGKFGEITLKAINRKNQDNEMLFEFNISGRLNNADE